MSPTVVGVSHSVTVETLDGSTTTPCPDTTCPRNPTSFEKNSHLLNLACNLCSLTFSNTKRRCASCSCSFFEYTNISSMNTTTNLSKNSINTLFIIFMKYAGALVNPNDITVLLVQPIPFSKSSLRNILLPNLHLMITRTKINLREYTSSLQLVK